MSMLTKTDSVSFVATLDAAKARTFYEDILGLTLVAEEYYALVFDLNGHVLRVAKVETLTPAEHTVLGWQVDDIASTAKTLSTRGIEFVKYNGMDQNDLGIWQSPSGAKIAWFKDPDGNNLSLTQLE